MEIRKDSKGFAGRIKQEELQFTVNTEFTEEEKNVIEDRIRELYDLYHESGHSLVSIAVYASYLEPNAHVRERQYQKKEQEKKKVKFLDDYEDD